MPFGHYLPFSLPAKTLYSYTLMKRRVSQIVIYLHGVVILQVFICMSVILSGIKPAGHVYLLLTSVQDTVGELSPGGSYGIPSFPTNR